MKLTGCLALAHLVVLVPAAAAQPVAEAVTIPCQGADGESTHELAGTLLLPEGDGPFGVVVLLTGSGPQDRDETVLEHKPFLAIAESLAAAGVATLRCDDRGIGQSTGDYATAMTRDFADDAITQVAWLAARDDINHDAIGVLGHSQGGVAAAIVAAEEPEIDFVIFSGTPGVDGATVMATQGGAMLRAIGRDESNAAESERLRREVLNKILEGASKEDTEALLRALIVNDAQQELPEAIMAQAVAQAWAQFTAPQIVGFVRDDPRPYLERVSVPVLIINGGQDLQVLADVNPPAIEAALREADNEHVTLRILESHNHLLQRCETGMMNEYATIDHPISEEALGVIRDWVLEQAGD